MSNFKTYHAKEQDVNSEWLLVNARNKSLGRLSTEIARRLLGKNNPRFTPGVDIAPHIVVINAAEVKPSREDKNFYWHTGYPGGIKQESIGSRLETKADKVVLKAVERMLPKNSHGRKLLTKLRVFVSSEHTHVAQQPKEIDF
jgi:large subunit ribosomal protein L13